MKSIVESILLVLGSHAFPSLSSLSGEQLMSQAEPSGIRPSMQLACMPQFQPHYTSKQMWMQSQISPVTVLRFSTHVPSPQGSPVTVFAPFTHVPLPHGSPVTESTPSTHVSSSPGTQAFGAFEGGLGTLGCSLPSLFYSRKI